MIEGEAEHLALFTGLFLHSDNLKVCAEVSGRKVKGIGKKKDKKG